MKISKPSRLPTPPILGDSPFVLTRETAEEIKRDLYESTLEGFAEELNKSSPAIKKLAKKFSWLIDEFFEGYKDGIAQEMELQLEKQSAGISDSLKEGEDGSLKDINETLKEISEKLNGVDPSSALSERLTPSKIAEAKEKSREILGRSSEVLKTKQGFATSAKEYALMSVFGAVGLDEYASKKIEESRRQEDFIKTETKLRSKSDEKFASLTAAEQRKILKTDYKTINKSTESLKELETEAHILRSQGYSEEQIDKKLGYAERRDELVKTIQKSDISRSSATSNTSSSLKSIVSSNSYTSNSTSLTEEESNEAFQVKEKEIRISETHTILLSEIRDLLKETKAKEVGSPVNSEAAAQSSGSGMPGIDIDLPGRKTTRVGRGGFLKGALSFGKNAFKFVKGAALPAAAMAGLGMGVDWLAGKAGVGQGHEVDIAQDDANWQKMSFAEKIQSAIPRGIEKVGSFIGLGSFTKEAQANRVANETAYFSRKGAEMVDAKTGTSSTIDIETAKSKLTDALSDPLTSADAKSLAKETLSSMGVSEPLAVTAADGVKKQSASIIASVPAASSNIASEIGKSIVINTPPPTVVNAGGGKSQIMQMPFTSNIRHKESTISDYIKSRYAPA